MTGEDRSRETKAPSVRRDEARRPGVAVARPGPSAQDAPPVGGVPAGTIRSVDLGPRSNGETEWQDEPGGPRTPPRDRKDD
jgi:hypothetical protein